ncbi:hypothetical protein QWR20_004234 [Vibrio fluvialis]|nr:hypothetical protein [Vibrio fluvialis]
MSRLLSSPPACPYVTVEQYMALSGLAEGTVKQFITDGRIIIKPKTKPREKTLINMVAMTEIATREAMELLG